MGSRSVAFNPTSTPLKVTHHSANLSKTTPRFLLPNGSILIHRLPSLIPSSASTSPSPSFTKSPPSSPTSYPPPSQLLPPRLKPFSSTPKLSPSDLVSLLSLRASNPSHWTVSKLSTKFNCSPTLILGKAPLWKCEELGRSRLSELITREKEDWKETGFNRKVTRIDRTRSKLMW